MLVLMVRHISKARKEIALGGGSKPGIMRLAMVVI
jgi:hypothetical protein